MPVQVTLGRKQRQVERSRIIPEGRRPLPRATPLWLQEDNWNSWGEQKDVLNHLCGSCELPNPWQQHYLTSRMGKSAAVAVEGSRVQPQLGLEMPLQ